MAALDMPIQELMEYKGVNPCPADFDAYWQRALACLDTQDMAYRLEKADFAAPGVECFHLWFTGVGGAAVHAQFVKPVDILGQAPAVLLFHGYQGSCGDWFEKLPFAQSGMVVAALDVRGQGGLSQDTGATNGSTHRGHIVRGMDDEDPDRLFFRNVYLDCAQLARLVAAMPFVDESRMAATGASQGGGLTAACAALYPGLRAIAPVMPFLSDFKRVWELDLDKAEEAYKEISIYFRTRDPLHQREGRFWQRLGYIDTHHLARYIRAETLFFATLMDNVCPPSTQFALYNAIPAAKQLRAYPEYAHERLPGQLDMTLQFFLDKLK